jgi:hypothetical protein
LTGNINFIKKVMIEAVVIRGNQLGKKEAELLQLEDVSTSDLQKLGIQLDRLNIDDDELINKVNQAKEEKMSSVRNKDFSSAANHRDKEMNLVISFVKKNYKKCAIEHSRIVGKTYFFREIQSG